MPRKYICNNGDNCQWNKKQCLHAIPHATNNFCDSNCHGNCNVVCISIRDK
jgi:hypothetical protein